MPRLGRVLVAAVVAVAAAAAGAEAAAGTPAVTRILHTVTKTVSSDCGTETTTSTHFTKGEGASDSKCATPGDGKQPAEPLPVSASLQADREAEADAKGQDGEEFDATKTKADGSCQSEEECKDRRPLLSAQASVAKIGDWLNNFRKTNRLDPRSVAEEMMAPMMQTLKRRNEIAETAIKEDQQFQREELAEQLSEHAYRQLRYEITHPQKIKPQPKDPRSLFQKMHETMHE